MIVGASPSNRFVIHTGLLPRRDTFLTHTGFTFYLLDLLAGNSHFPVTVVNQRFVPHDFY
jgi:hypothetical protein